MSVLRSLLFVPAVRPRMIDSALKTAADAIVLDLEDAVPAPEKQAARELAAERIPAVAGAGRTVLARVNAIDTGLTRDDLMAVAAPGLFAVVLPKVEHPQDLRDLDVLLREAETERGIRPGTIGVLPLIESARAVLRCEEIARAIDRLIGISIGGEDYTADIGVERDAEGLALQHIRAVVVQVAAALGVVPIDTPWIDFRDADGLREDARRAKAIGLKGKYVIHPDQVEIVNETYSPTPQEVERARRIVEAFDRAGGAAAINVDGRMVDAPIVARARAILELAGDR